MALKPPDDSSLFEAAMNHLARHAATEVGMARVLSRRIDRWVRREAAVDGADEAALGALARRAKTAIAPVVARLKAAGVLSDEAFAASRGKRLAREGKSRRYALAHLAAKGVALPQAQAAVADDPERELAAACAFLRRRRAGPFGEADRLKALAAMARGGFSQEVARRALGLERAVAEELIKLLHE